MSKITQQEHYRDVHLLAAPARALESVFGAIAIVLLLIGCGVGYPIYLLCTGQHITVLSLVVSGLTILALITFFVAPYYFMAGGLLGLYLIAHFGDTNEDAVVNLLSGWGFAWMVFGFLALGILQKYVRYRISRPKPIRSSARFNLFDKPERSAQQIAKMGPLQYQTCCTLYGDDPTQWPDDLDQGWEAMKK